MVARDCGRGCVGWLIGCLWLGGLGCLLFGVCCCWVWCWFLCGVLFLGLVGGGLWCGWCLCFCCCFCLFCWCGLGFGLWYLGVGGVVWCCCGLWGGCGGGCGVGVGGVVWVVWWLGLCVCGVFVVLLGCLFGVRGWLLGVSWWFGWLVGCFCLVVLGLWGGVVCWFLFVWGVGGLGFWFVCVVLVDYLCGWVVAVVGKFLADKSYSPMLSTGGSFVYRSVPRVDERYFGVQLRKDF
ncbi:hypothetical protein [Pseudomonas syringae group genomosp. 7]|uniref:hypothetical protein n=1 Tax=Pseudomonas syringae group genomosp. 7 TaxID=251699 RepID=UPI0037706B41